MILARTRGQKYQITDHFWLHEFDCQCEYEECTSTLYSLELVKLVEKLRESCGNKPFKVLSGYRCPRHNTDTEGSSKKSQHIVGLACDLVIPKSLGIEEFHYRASNIGFSMILDYATRGFMHIDIRDGNFI